MQRFRMAQSTGSYHGGRRWRRGPARFLALLESLEVVCVAAAAPEGEERALAGLRVVVVALECCLAGADYLRELADVLL